MDNGTSKESAILEVVAPSRQLAGNLRELRRRSLQVLYLVALSAAVLAAAHVALIDAFRRETPDNFRNLVIVVEIIFVGVLLAGTATYLLALVRERSGRFVLDALTAAFATSSAADQAPGIAVAHLVGSGVATSALLALARDQGHRLEPIAACGYPPDAPLDTRDSYGLVPPQPVVRQQVELTDPWLDPARERIGSEPWIARVPILHGDELLGLLVLANPRPGLINDRALLRPLSTLLAVALAGAGSSALARAAGVSDAEWTRHELIEATAAEFGPPLLAVEAFAAAVAGDAETVGTIEDARRLSTLALSVERLGVVMSDLSTLGAGAAALVVGEPEPVDLAPILDAAVDALEPAFRAREQALTLELRNEPLTAFVSPDAVERLLLHLLSNANRAAPDGGSVAVRAVTLEDVVRIEVEDSGTAPRGDELQHALDAFHRVSEGAGTLPGAGLGLAVAGRLADSQGGHLEARRSDSGGTLFVVDLPVNPPEEPSAPPALPPDREETAVDDGNEGFLDDGADEELRDDEFDDSGDEEHVTPPEGRPGDGPGAAIDDEEESPSR